MGAQLGYAVFMTIILLLPKHEARQAFRLFHPYLGKPLEEKGICLFAKKYDDLFLNLDINKLSDQYFYEDFFPEEYGLYPKPDNIITLQKTFPNAVASIWARFQANNFYRTDSS